MNESSISRRSFLLAAALCGADIAAGPLLSAPHAAVRKSRTGTPVVVIGAGLGGLAAAALLAREGFPVTVFEQHDIPGGYATTFDRARGRFTFDVSLHRTTLSPERLSMLEAIGVRDKVTFVDIPTAARVITPTTDERIDFAPEARREWLVARFPEEAAGLERYFNAVKGILDELNTLKYKGTQRDFPSRYPKLWQIRDKNLSAFLDEFVTSEEVKTTLSAGWGAHGTPPSRLSAFYYIVATHGTSTRPKYIKPRSQALSTAIAEAVEAAGGRIHFQTTVTGIQVQNNAVTGVIADEASFHPAKVVVCNASAATALHRLLPPGSLPKDYARQVEGYRPSLSTFIVWLGLNRDIRKTVPDSRIVFQSGDGIDADYRACIEGNVEKMPMSVTVYDHYYDGYSTPGTSTLALITICGYGPWRQFETDYTAGRKAAYLQEKKRWARQMIQRLEQTAIPGLSSMIEVMEAATPLTNRRYTGNPEGAFTGYEQSVGNSFMARIKNETPVNGLFLAGAWGNPGGGYTGALKGGELTFRQILKASGGLSA